VTCGATTGPKVSVDIRRLFWYQWDILGSTMGSLQDYREIIQVLSQGRLRPTVDSTFSLEEGVQAFSRLQEGEHMGKVVVEIP
jgi:D-arabinose 1-dehydrogenase-like Zn-dependent alcohol dehydrogenase